MKKGGIVNARLVYALARLGHTDRLVVCDAGLPIPPGTEIVDLAFRFGTPSFETVLDGILEELVIEGATRCRRGKRAEPVGSRPHELAFIGPGLRSPRRVEAYVVRRPARRPDRGGVAFCKRRTPLRGAVLNRRA